MGTTQMSHYDLNARLDGPTPDGDDGDQPVAAGKAKKRKGKKNKKKGDQDELQAFDMNTGNYTTDMALNDTETPMAGKKVKKDKKKKKKDKGKNKGDELQSVAMEDEGPEEGQHRSSDDK